MAGIDGPDSAIRIADGRMAFTSGTSRTPAADRLHAILRFGSRAGIATTARPSESWQCFFSRSVRRAHPRDISDRRRRLHCRRRRVLRFRRAQGRFRLGHQDLRIPIVVWQITTCGGRPHIALTASPRTGVRGGEWPVRLRGQCRRRRRRNTGKMHRGRASGWHERRLGTASEAVTSSERSLSSTRLATS